MKNKTLYNLIKDAPVCQTPTPSPTINQREDGSWFWLDETWNDGDNVHYATREEAQAAQSKYCAWLMEGAE